MVKIYPKSEIRTKIEELYATRLENKKNDDGWENEYIHALFIRNHYLHIAHPLHMFSICKYCSYWMVTNSWQTGDEHGRFPLKSGRPIHIIVGDPCREHIGIELSLFKNKIIYKRLLIWGVPFCRICPSLSKNLAAIFKKNNLPYQEGIITADQLYKMQKLIVLSHADSFSEIDNPTFNDTYHAAPDKGFLDMNEEWGTHCPWTLKFCADHGMKVKDLKKDN